MALTPYTRAYGNLPLTQITPFTYRDGLTFLQILNEFEKWLREVTPEIDGILKTYFDRYKADHEALKNDIDATKDQWQALFDAFIANIVVELEALNDQAAANLVNNANSLLREALDTLIYESRRVRTSPVYYVATTGSDANSGLTASSPRKTVNSIISDTQDDLYGVDTEIIINVAAGEYSETVRFEDTTGEIKRYRIRGVEVSHPNRPQVIWSQGLGSTGSGFVVRSKAIDLTVEFIEFYGYSGNASSAGIALADARLLTNNCHFQSCFFGITAQRAVLGVPNGLFENCGTVHGGGSSSAGAGVRSLMLTNHSIGNQYGTLENSAIFRNNSYGFLAQESSVGHVDNCTFDNNIYGVVTRVNSRANAASSRFSNNDVGVLCADNSNVLVGVNSFQDGNKTKFVSRSGGIVTYTTFDAYINGKSGAEYTTTDKYVSVFDPMVHRGPSETIYERMLTKNFWDAGKSTTIPVRKVIMKLTGFIAGSNLSKTLGLRLGLASEDANSFFTIPSSHFGSFTAEFSIGFGEPGKQVMSGQLLVSDKLPLISSVASNVVMSEDKQLRLHGATYHDDDVINIRSLEIYVER